MPGVGERLYKVISRSDKQNFKGGSNARAMRNSLQAYSSANGITSKTPLPEAMQKKSYMR